MPVPLVTTDPQTTRARNPFPREGNKSADAVPLGLLGRRLARALCTRAGWGFGQGSQYSSEQGPFGLSRVWDTKQVGQVLVLTGAGEPRHENDLHILNATSRDSGPRPRTPNGRPKTRRIR